MRLHFNLRLFCSIAGIPFFGVYAVILWFGNSESWCESVPYKNLF
jgi:hypothetical protein